jgi:hypothetical protein
MISGNFPHQSIIDIISRKNELRQQLKEM